MERALGIVVIVLCWLVGVRSAWADIGPVVNPNIPGPILPSDTVLSSSAIGYLGGSGSVSASGEYVWQLPLWTPDGRAGFEPELSIHYGSRGGNGLLGVGFSLSGLSAITRCGQNIAIDGVTRGVDFSSEDRFCLDGQRLVLIAGNYGENGSEYRTERESYRKILFWEGDIFEPGHFVVQTKEGFVLEYRGIKAGRAKPSILPPHEMFIFERADVLWVLKSIADRSGNEIVFNYDIKNPVNDFTLEYLPQSIEYGQRSVRFVYEDRIDPSFSWLSGVKLLSTKVLKAIEMHAPNPNAVETVQSYQFDYLTSATTHRSLLKTIARCDFEHTCLWAKEFQWQTGKQPDFTVIDLPQYDFSVQHFATGLDTGIVVLDMDGDASDEIIYRKEQDYFVGHTDPQGSGMPLGVKHKLTQANTAGPSGEHFRNIDLLYSRPFDLEGDGAIELWGAQWVYPEAYVLFQWDKNSQTPRCTDIGIFASVIQSGQNLALSAMQVGDLDGDGLTDMLLQDFMPNNTPLWNFVMNTGSAPFQATWTNAPAFYGYQGKIVDLEGDGRAEVMNAGDIGKQETVAVGLNPDISLKVDPVMGLPFPERNGIWADINGDGIRDIVHLGDFLGVNGGWVRFGTGTGYAPRVTLIDGPYKDGNVIAGMDTGTFVADVNSDGRDDFVSFHFEPSPKILVHLSKGNGTFSTEELNTWPGQFHSYEGFSTSRIGDFNGDGLVDLLLVSGNYELRVLQQTPGPVDVISEVWDDFVGAHPREKILYSEQWSEAPELANCTFPQRCIKHGMPVVRKHQLWQGERVGQYRSFDYEYQDPRMDLHGRGFLEFAQFIEKDIDRKSQTTTAFDLDTTWAGIYVYAGLPKLIEHQNAEDQRILITNSYKIKSKNGGLTYSVEPHISNKQEYEHDVLMREQSTTTLFDAYGNLTLHERWTLGGTYERTENVYSNDESTWTLGLLKSSDFVSSKDGLNPLPQARHTEYGYDPNGLLKSVLIEPNAAEDNQKRTTTLIRDGDGLVSQIVVETPGLPSRNLYIAYDDQERIYPVSVWNDLGFTAQYRYHPGLGVLGASWDMHGIESRMQYDGFGRLLHRETDGEPSEDVWMNVSMLNGVVNGLMLQSSTTLGDESVMVIDELGRPVAQGTKAFDGQWSYSKQRYDLLGRIVEAWRPAIGAPSQYSSKMIYDSLNRMKSIEGPDGAQTNFDYTFFQTEVSDPDGRVSKTIFDSDGRLWRSIDVLNGQDIVTEFHWGDFDQIQEVIDHKGNVTGFLYDQRGRRILLSDPDRGIVAFDFNGFDELIWEKNGLQQETSYVRDQLGRVADILNVDGLTHFEWDVNSAGQVAWATSPEGTRRDFLYDGLGRLETSIWKVNGETYAVDFGYDQGRLSRIDYPQVPGQPRFGVEFIYNQLNYLEQIRNADTGEPYWTVTARNAEGRLESGLFGNLLKQDRSYDPVTGRLNAIQTGNGQLIDSLAYKYWAGGDLRSREDAIAGRNEEFWYDDLGRLETWKLTTQNVSAKTDYGFDELGNLKHVWKDNVLQENNGYGINNTKPHALTSTVKGLYSYDDIGRMVQGGGRGISYTAFDLPSSIVQNGMTTSFAYDAFHERVRKTGPLGDTVYIGELYERRESASGFEHVFFVPGESGPAAEVHWNETTQTQKIFYLPGDALGSVRVVTDETGKEIERAYFDPFGQRIDEEGTPILQNPNLSPAVHWGFTGYLHDYELGLIHARGRAYDPLIKHFYTPDPIIKDPGFGQAYNRYSYAWGNPLRYTDPSGFETCGDDGDCSLNVKAPAGLDTPVGTLKKIAPKPTSGPSAAESPEAAGTESHPSASADSDGAKPATGATANSTTAQPGSGTSNTSSLWNGPSPPALVAANPPPLDREGASGLALGFFQGLTPGAALLDANQRALGTSPRSSPSFERFKYFGQAIGGLALTAFGMGGSVGGIGLNATGIGALVGVPALAVSSTVITAGVANTLAGWQGLWQSLATGGSAGPPGVSAGPAAPVTHKHHIATNKNSVSDARGGPWTPKFEKIFKRAGMSLDDPENIIEIAGHQGPHPEAYHAEVFARLDKATDGLSGDSARQALIAQLSSIRKDIATPGSVLHKLVTGQ